MALFQEIAHCSKIILDHFNVLKINYASIIIGHHPTNIIVLLIQNLNSHNHAQYMTLCMHEGDLQACITQHYDQVAHEHHARLYTEV